jgi:hypothetical protein
VSVAERSRRRPSTVGLVLVALVLGAVTAAAVAVALSGEGSAPGAAPSGGLEWAKPPLAFEAPGNPRDRIVSGTVRNDSLQPVEVEARDIRVVGADGRPRQAAGIFLNTFVRGIYSAGRTDQASAFERIRTGRLARLGPGQTRPLTVSWRTPPGAGRAERIDYGAGSLPIPW